MKLNTLIASGIFIMGLSMVAPTYAQDQQDHPTKPEEGKPEDKPKQQAEPPKTPNDQPRSTEREAKPPEEKQPRGEAKPPEGKQPRPEKQEASREPQQNKQTAQQHGRIPDDKYRANFGKEHRFHIGHPTVVEGRPRFQYGGYSFFIAEAWPSGWSYDDYVYIIEINGIYYLVDDGHPGVQLALTIE